MKRYLVWMLAIFNSVMGLTRLIAKLVGLIGDELSFNAIIGALIIIIGFSVMGAIIILRTEGNRIGWLMVLLGFVLADPFATYLALGGIDFTLHLSFFVYFAFWTQGWFFFISIYAIFMIVMYFPDGRPPGPRWKWINLISLFTLIQYILFYTIQPQYGDSTMFIDNPIAILSMTAEKTFSGVLFGIGLILLAVSSIVSIFIRFRRSGDVERSQIKWLLFSGTISFVAIAYRLAVYDPSISDWTDYLLTIAQLSMTISISIAILRYRLYDIDIIIRRTIQYAILSGVLAMIYFGSVILLQNLAETLLGKQSPFVIVISTLAIAALFNPLRIRLQDFIDKRFYRSKYNAEKALTQFAATARDEVDINKLSAALLEMMDETMQPDKINIWLKPTHHVPEKFVEPESLQTGSQA